MVSVVIKLFFFYVSFIFGSCLALDISTPQVPATGVENIASHELEKSDAWWAKNFDDDQVLAEPDPLEPMNRVFFNFNRVLDGVLLKPLAIGYDNLLPDHAKEGVSNFMDNLFYFII